MSQSSTDTIQSIIEHAELAKAHAKQADHVRTWQQLDYIEKLLATAHNQLGYEMKAKRQVDEQRQRHEQEGFADRWKRNIGGLIHGDDEDY